MTEVQTLAARKVICLDGLDGPGTVGERVVISQGRILEVGNDRLGSDPEVLDGFLLPGFIDAHLHLTTTGLYRSGLDLTEARSVDEALDLIARHVKSSKAPWIIGGNFDPGRNRDGRMPERGELDRASSDRPMLISRADGHSCALNSLGLEAVDLDRSLPGIDLAEGGVPTGILRHQANYSARRAVFSSLPPQQVTDAQGAACRVALEAGVTSVHEMAGGSYMGDRDFELLLDGLDSLPIHVVVYLATLDVRRAVGAGLKQVGGDLFLDGSIGSRTAAMSRPYEDEATLGSLYHSDEEVAEFFLEATRAGIQAGVHAIGDAAVEQALAGLEAASDRLGPGGAAAVARLHHRIEHIECVDEPQLRRAARLGVIPSIQPAFDHLWGAASGMYAQRLGDRAAGMNPFSTMIRLGLHPAGGSDSTVTPLDPLLGVHSAVNHHNPDQAVPVVEALRMFTAWAAAAAGEASERGSIERGKAADLVLLDRNPLETPPDEIKEIGVLRTWVAGQSLFMSGG